MYGTLLPSMVSLDPLVSVPATFYADDDEDVIVMENLKAKGFDIEEKTRGQLNLQPTLLFFDASATAQDFHLLHACFQPINVHFICYLSCTT